MKVPESCFVLFLRNPKRRIQKTGVKADNIHARSSFYSRLFNNYFLICGDIRESMTRNTQQIHLSTHTVWLFHPTVNVPLLLRDTFGANKRSTCCITNTTFATVSSCGLLKWDATLEWYNSTSLGLQSLSDSLLSPVTYLGGFLKRSQRKHFHFSSHLTLSKGARWRDSWLEVTGEEGYTVSKRDTWEGGLVEVRDWTAEM